MIVTILVIGNRFQFVVSIYITQPIYVAEIHIYISTERGPVLGRFLIVVYNKREIIIIVKKKKVP